MNERKVLSVGGQVTAIRQIENGGGRIKLTWVGNLVSYILRSNRFVKTELNFVAFERNGSRIKRVRNRG